MRTLSAIFVLIIPAASLANGLRFDVAVFDAGFQVDQPVLVASLQGSERHVVLAGRNENHEQRFAVFSLDDTSNPVIAIEPGPQLIAYDTGRIGDRDSLFFIEPGRIMRLDVASGDIEEFVSIRSIYGQYRSGQLVPIDFVRDVNGDDRDDLVVPDTAGYRVRLQRDDGSFGDEVILQESSAMTVSGGTVSFESRPLVTGNMTDDDLPDLAVWRGDTLRISSMIWPPTMAVVTSLIRYPIVPSR